MITKDMTLADVVKAHPNTIGFLNGLHLDYCCGGHEAISIAIREKGMDVEKFLAELNEVAARPTAAKDVHADIESFKDLKVTEMLDDLEATHPVFPLMRQHPHPDKETLDLVQQLEDEHTGAGDVIKEIQQLTNNFTPPEDACPTFRHTYATMEALFDDIFIHIFKENSIAFPEYAEQQ